MKLFCRFYASWKFSLAKFLILVFPLVFAPLLRGQQNLIRNHSFENGIKSPNKYPKNSSELDGKCAHWRQYLNTTSNWFRDAPGFLRGAASCTSGDNVWGALPPNPRDDGEYYAGVVKFNSPRGEGLQQRMMHKIKNKTYIFSFDYLIPCDSVPYLFDLFFGTSINDTSHHVRQDTLDRSQVGVWKTYQYTFTVPPIYENQYDWFV
jgi:hypothetical protein